MHSRRRYRHGKLPATLVATAREILDEDDLQEVGLRETARRVGVSTTAAYRHFASKDDLLASVAAEGFRELAAAMQSATLGASPFTRAALAYINFACQNPSVFRLMFGPVLAQRAKYPALRAATPGIETMLLRGVADVDQVPLDDNHAEIAAWGLVHGLAHLFVNGFFPSARGGVPIEEILGRLR
jgi:AcrR family transcriptional regulator